MSEENDNDNKIVEKKKKHIVTRTYFGGLGREVIESEENKNEEKKDV